ncbi:tetraacyldisaccharide 4'-kinase [soil metagenome]
MQFLKFLLIPVSWLYGLVISLRNFCYDKNIFKSRSFSFPVINVGNLTMGGTGKTPHIEYLIRLLKDTYRIATLSRGYGRKTQGFMLVSNPSSTAMVGDEPMQYHLKFPEITVSVGEDRVAAIENLMKLQPKPETILLDDAYQHRAVKPGLNILLIEHDAVMKKDYLLPSGTLREWKRGMKRADVIIISKCPEILVPIERKRLAEHITLLPEQKLFFSFFRYGDIVRLNSKSGNMLIGTNYYFEKRFTILLVTGIANPSGIAEYLKRKTDKLETIVFRDHHEFTPDDIRTITETFNNIANANKIIVTTEKDAMRLRNPELDEATRALPIFYLPVQVQFHHQDKEQFDNIVLNYARQNQTNRFIHQREN